MWRLVVRPPREEKALYLRCHSEACLKKGIFTDRGLYVVSSSDRLPLVQQPCAPSVCPLQRYTWAAPGKPNTYGRTHSRANTLHNDNAHSWSCTPTVHTHRSAVYRVTPQRQSSQRHDLPLKRAACLFDRQRVWYALPHDVQTTMLRSAAVPQKAHHLILCSAALPSSPEAAAVPRLEARRVNACLSCASSVVGGGDAARPGDRREATA